MLPDVVLIDAEASDSNWEEAVGKLKQQEKWNEVPVILYAAHIDGEIEDKAMDLGASHLISKPVRLIELLEKLR